MGATGAYGSRKARSCVDSLRPVTLGILLSGTLVLHPSGQSLNRKQSAVVYVHIFSFPPRNGGLLNP